MWEIKSKNYGITSKKLYLEEENLLNPWLKEYKSIIITKLKI